MDYVSLCQIYLLVLITITQLEIDQHNPKRNEFSFLNNFSLSVFETCLFC